MMIKCIDVSDNVSDSTKLLLATVQCALESPRS
jgi:hypothetical protein